MSAAFCDRCTPLSAHLEGCSQTMCDGHNIAELIMIALYIVPSLYLCKTFFKRDEKWIDLTNAKLCISYVLPVFCIFKFIRVVLLMTGVTNSGNKILVILDFFLF